MWSLRRANKGSGREAQKKGRADEVRSALKSGEDANKGTGFIALQH